VEVSVCCTHPILSGPAIDRIAQSELKEVIVTDTVPLHEKAKACDHIKVLSVAGLLSEAVRRSTTTIQSVHYSLGGISWRRSN
jgi:ribose-phosphate pyrophosphokinase